MITGEESEKENDLIRYSNYMSGAGSTFGGFMAELPGDIGDITDGRNIINKHLNAMITLLYSANFSHNLHSCKMEAMDSYFVVAWYI